MEFKFLDIYMFYNFYMNVQLSVNFSRNCEVFVVYRFWRKSSSFRWISLSWVGLSIALCFDGFLPTWWTFDCDEYGYLRWVRRLNGIDFRGRLLGYGVWMGMIDRHPYTITCLESLKFRAGWYGLISRSDF